jgi:hypothetical protein
MALYQNRTRRQEKGLDEDLEQYANQSDSRTISNIRDFFKLPPLGIRESVCGRCSRPYDAQTVGGVKTEFFCLKCRWSLLRESVYP